MKQGRKRCLRRPVGAYASHRIDSIVDTLSPRIAILYPGFLGYINDASIGQPDQLDWVREPKGFHSRIVEKLLSSIDRMPQWAENLRFRFHIWRAVRKNKVIVIPFRNLTSSNFAQTCALFLTACRNATCVLSW